MPPAARDGKRENGRGPFVRLISARTGRARLRPICIRNDVAARPGSAFQAGSLLRLSRICPATISISPRTSAGAAATRCLP